LRTRQLAVAIKRKYRFFLGSAMTEKQSRAKAIKAFIDRLSFSSPKSNQNVMQVIGASFGLKPDSSSALRLVHSQVENFEKLLSELALSSVGPEAKEEYKSHCLNWSCIRPYMGMLKPQRTILSSLTIPLLRC
jgi:hypothetical protein